MRLYFSKKNRSMESERKLAKQLDGKVQPASGALPVNSLKGDVVTDLFVLDDKNTVADSFGVKLSVFEALRKQALFNRVRKPAIRIRFERHDKALFVISERDFLEYNQLLRERAARES